MAEFDMPEYMEEHSVAKFIGRPPGYIGHDEEGQLTRRLHTIPFSAVLFDEVEKAHPRVLDVLLHLFDSGRIIAAKGRAAAARNAIFILTSNLQIAKECGFGLNKGDADLRAMAPDGAGKFFRREKLNPLGEIVEFHKLDPEDVERILNPLLAEVCRNLNARYGVSLEVEPDARAFIARGGYSDAFGVWELRRTVNVLVSLPRSRLLHSSDFERSQKWKVRFHRAGLEILEQ